MGSSSSIHQAHRVSSTLTLSSVLRAFCFIAWTRISSPPADSNSCALVGESIKVMRMRSSSGMAMGENEGECKAGGKKLSRI